METSSALDKAQARLAAIRKIADDLLCEGEDFEERVLAIEALAEAAASDLGSIPRETAL